MRRDGDYISAIGPPEVEILVVIVLPIFLKKNNNAENKLRKHGVCKGNNMTHYAYPEIDIELGTPSIKLSLLISSAIATLN